MCSSSSLPGLRGRRRGRFQQRHGKALAKRRQQTRRPLRHLMSRGSWATTHGQDHAGRCTSRRGMQRWAKMMSTRCSRWRRMARARQERQVSCESAPWLLVGYTIMVLELTLLSRHLLFVQARSRTRCTSPRRPLLSWTSMPTCANVRSSACWQAHSSPQPGLSGEELEEDQRLLWWMLPWSMLPFQLTVSAMLASGCPTLQCASRTPSA